LSRLYYVYFGLSFLGMASALFALFCPLDIKNHGSAREYLEVEGPLVTKSRMGLIIPDIAWHYRFWQGEEFQEQPPLTQILGEPDLFISLFVGVVSELYSAIPADEEPASSEAPAEAAVADVTETSATQVEEVGDEGPFFNDPYVDHRGYPDPWKIAEALYMQRRLEQGFNYQVRELSTTDAFRNDVLTLHYMALDNSKPWFRIVVTSFYATGFVLLLIPTAITFVQLAVRALAP
jgi:hypothetical protein